MYDYGNKDGMKTKCAVMITHIYAMALECIGKDLEIISSLVRLNNRQIYPGTIGYCNIFENESQNMMILKESTYLA